MKELPFSIRHTIKPGLIGLAAGTILFLGNDSASSTDRVIDYRNNTNTPEIHVSNPESDDIENIVDKKRRELETRLEISLQTFDDISQNPMTKLLYGLKNFLPINQEWNEENLRLLEKILQYVPEEFYEPRNGENVHVILGPTSHCGHDIKGFTPKYPYEVMLSYSMFMPNKPLTAIFVASHEFGHLMTTESCNSSLSPSYLEQLQDITGQNFSDLQEQLPIQIDDRADEMGIKVKSGGKFTTVDSLTPEEEEALRLTRLNYGTKNPKEFMGVLFESYIMGRDYFYRMYEPFFGSETESLYDWMKDIYGNREFPDYSTTQQELQQ